MKKWTVAPEIFKERMFRLTHATRTEEAIHLEEVLINSYNEVYSELATAKEEAAKLNRHILKRIQVLTEGLVRAREFMKHEKEDCWSTGPNSGEPIQDHIICPGCRAICEIDILIGSPAPEGSGA
ncbi:MAG TPA: hypothetical protein VGM92_06990 [Candidatus Kapabacteria bacterium]|jgi:hypothetical protein